MLRPADAATKICCHPRHCRHLCAFVARWLFFGPAAAKAVGHHAGKNQTPIEANHRRRRSKSLTLLQRSVVIPATLLRANIRSHRS
ncbi:unnamed protein product [Cuscuta campestris]|uniref:Secreted protein n=1 Tax=Cuscuta campestris TaxID=132261 RepID=A0A484KNM3_9ASTE|nr:unnamed protein product [Cuscuta campestris]